MGLGCKLFILVAVATMTPPAPLEEMERVLEDLLLLEEVKEELAEKQSAELKICVIDKALKTMLNRFRFRKGENTAAVIMKIDREADTCKVVEDEVFEDIDPDALGKALPAHEPRYVAYSYCYHHDNGRISYPLIFIFSSPTGTAPELQMMYAGTKNQVVTDLQFTKVFEVRNPEEITQEWLDSKLSFLRS